MNTHGDIRNYRLETTSMGAPTMAITDGGMSFTLPASTVTMSVSDQYCAVHGWVEVRGVMGALVWHLEHDECAP
jgi:hypothetical protein